MQKPGHDYYSIIVSVQIIICLYLILFYPNMEGQNLTIVD